MPQASGKAAPRQESEVKSPCHVTPTSNTRPLATQNSVGTDYVQRLTLLGPGLPDHEPHDAKQP